MSRRTRLTGGYPQRYVSNCQERRGVAIPTPPKKQEPTDSLVVAAARSIYETMPVGERLWEHAPAFTRARCFICAEAALTALRPGGPDGREHPGLARRVLGYARKPGKRTADVILAAIAERGYEITRHGPRGRQNRNRDMDVPA